MFEKIFVEKNLLEHTRAQHILSQFPQIPRFEIDRYDQIFGQKKKPYLHKRTSLNLFIAQKKGQLVKTAPEAYGLSGDPHYYFVHAYNCIYECQYCYLQGYFHSPDIVLFINHEDIGQAIENKILQTPLNQTSWFHAGEFSDSLALSHITKELDFYFNLFSRYPNAKLEFRSKSANVRELLQLDPQENIITSFSLAPEESCREFDLKAPPLKIRVQAMHKLIQKGHPIALHFDPVIYSESFEADYRELFELLPLEKAEYISIGVVRFTSSVYKQVQKNYPRSRLLTAPFVKSFDQKVRYPQPMRQWILGKLKSILLDYAVSTEKIYLCME